MLGSEGRKLAAHRKYPWEVWFSQPRTVLVRGRDYHIDSLTMFQTIKNNATKYGVRVKVIDNHPEGLILWTTVIDQDGNPAAPPPKRAAPPRVQNESTCGVRAK